MEVLSYITSQQQRLCLFFLFLSSLQSIVHDLHCVLLIQGIKIGEKGEQTNKTPLQNPPTFWLSIPLPYLGTHSKSSWAPFLISYSSGVLMTTARATVWSWTDCLLHKVPSWKRQVRTETQSTVTTRICHQCPAGKASYLWGCFADARGVSPSLRKSIKILPRSSQGKWSELQY